MGFKLKKIIYSILRIRNSMFWLKEKREKTLSTLNEIKRWKLRIITFLRGFVLRLVKFIYIFQKTRSIYETQNLFIIIISRRENKNKESRDIIYKEKNLIDFQSVQNLFVCFFYILISIFVYIFAWFASKLNWHAISFHFCSKIWDFVKMINMI